MVHTGNINQHELLKSDTTVTIMVALKTMLIAYYDTFFSSFFPLLFVIYSQT